MPRINLLPIKAAKRNESAKRELFAMIFAFVILLGGLWAWNDSIDQEILNTRSRIKQVKAKIKDLSKDVSRVEEFKAKSETLEKKAQIIEKLKRQKIGPAKMLDDLATIITQEKRIWLLNMIENPKGLTLSGGAMEHEDISEFQIGLEKRSNFFTKIKLEKIKTRERDDTRYLEWQMTCVPDFSAE